MQSGVGKGLAPANLGQCASVCICVSECFSVLCVQLCVWGGCLSVFVRVSLCLYVVVK